MVSQKAPGQSVGMDAPSTTGGAIPETLGRYRLLSKIAKGGMAEVFAARSYGVHGFEKTVAVKRILPRFGQDPQFVRMMVDEAKISVLLNHPNIAQILELGEQPIEESQFAAEGRAAKANEYFIVMEFVAGQSLSAVIKRLRAAGERVPQLESCFIVVELLQGLHAAHTQTDHRGKPANIIHRDVSPQNTLVSFDGHVKVIDFGIARARDRLEATEVGTIKGKLRYLAPEMIDPGRFCEDGDFDHRVDVFAAGIVLWELVSGRTLFPGDEELKVYDDITDGVTPDLHKEGLCDAGLMKIIGKALERRLERRYESAEEFADELRSYLYRKDPGFTHKRVAAILDKHFPAEKAELTSLERGMSSGEIGAQKAQAQKKAGQKALSAPEPAETRHMRSDSHPRGPSSASPAAPAPDAATTAIADRDELQLDKELPRQRELTVVTLVSRQHVMGTGLSGQSSKPDEGSGVFSMPDDATLTISADTLREEKARLAALRSPSSSSGPSSGTASSSAPSMTERVERRRADDVSPRNASSPGRSLPSRERNSRTRRRLIAASAAVGVLLALGIVAVMEFVDRPATSTPGVVTAPANDRPDVLGAPVLAPAFLVVRSPVVGATAVVSREGEPAQSGPTPLKFAARAGESLQIRLTAPGTRDEVETVVVPVGHEGDFFVDVSPRFVAVPVRLDVKPPNAQVLMNGEVLANDATVEPGVAVVIDVSAVGYAPARQELKAVPGQPLVISVSLVKDKDAKDGTKKPPPPPPQLKGNGTLTLKTTPYWGTVNVDGKLYDEQTPLSVTLSAGKHDVIVAHPPKGLMRKFKIVIKPGETVTRTITFE